MSDSLIRFAEEFWTGMLVHLWQTTLVLAVLWILSRTVKNAPSRVQASLWWIGVLKLFLPLSLLAPLTDRLVRSTAGWFESAPLTAQVEWISATIWLYPVTIRVPVESSSSPTGWIYAAMLLAWFAGLGWILFRRLSQFKQGRRETLRAQGLRRERLESRLEEALRTTSISRAAVRLVQGSGMPAVRGLLRPRIELPAQIVDRLDTTDLSAVLLHEEEHRRRRDPLRQIPAAVASWLFFFYPPLRWLLREIHETTEMACDEAVLRAGIEPRDYARSIARTLELGLSPADARPAFIGPGRSSIRRRLARLDAKRSHRTMLTHRMILAVAALIALFGSIAPLTPGARAGAERPVNEPRSGRFAALDDLADPDLEVSLNFNQVELEKILDALSRVAPLKLELDETVAGKSLSIEMERTTLREALIELSLMAGLQYKVPDPKTLWVSRILLPGTDGVTPPRRIPESAAKPVYPEELRKAKIQGRIIVEAVIDTSGAVTEVEVLRNSQPDHPAMADAAVEAVRQWHYEPAMLDGEPVSVYFTVVIQFELNGDKKTPETGGETL